MNEKANQRTKRTRNQRASWKKKTKKKKKKASLQKQRKRIENKEGSKTGTSVLLVKFHTSFEEPRKKGTNKRPQRVRTRYTKRERECFSTSKNTHNKTKSLEFQQTMAKKRREKDLRVLARVCLWISG